MGKRSLTDRLFHFLWYRYVEGATDEEAAELADITAAEVRQQRARRTPAYRAAEARLERHLPPEMLLRYSRAVQARALLTETGTAAVQVAARVLEAHPQSDQPTQIAFIIQEAEPQEEPSREEAEERAGAGRGASPARGPRLIAMPAHRPTRTPPSRAAAPLLAPAVLKSVDPDKGKPLAPPQSGPA
jgi:hypothetical protein